MNKSGGLSGLITWVLCTVGLVIFLFVAYFAIGLLRSFDTQYAPGYSAAAFDSIKLGDTEQKVLSALGNPFSTNDTKPHVAWVYSADRQPKFSSNGEASGTHTTVRFNEKGYVVAIFGQLESSAGLNVRGTFGGAGYLNLSEAQIDQLKGKTQDEVKKQLGVPVAIFEYKASKLLRYSRSPSSSNYRLRLVGLDARGKVVYLSKEIYWD